MAASRRPNTQALARSTANQSHTLCRLRPKNVHISSSSSASAALLSAAGAAVPGWLAALFLPVWPPSCVRRPSPARCCVANYARLTTFLPGYRALLARLRRAQTGPGARNHCSGSGHARRCGRCDEFARCSIWRTYVESLPSTLYKIHPALYHRQKFYPKGTTPSLYLPGFTRFRPPLNLVCNKSKTVFQLQKRFLIKGKAEPADAKC